MSVTNLRPSDGRSHDEFHVPPCQNPREPASSGHILGFSRRQLSITSSELRMTPGEKYYQYASTILERSGVSGGGSCGSDRKGEIEAPGLEGVRPLDRGPAYVDKPSSSFIANDNMYVDHIRSSDVVSLDLYCVASGQPPIDLAVQRINDRYFLIWKALHGRNHRFARSCRNFNL